MMYLQNFFFDADNLELIECIKHKSKGLFNL